MKKTLMLLMFLVSFIACQNENCVCPIEDGVLIKNDSIINSVVNQPRNGFKNYWDRFEEPILSEQEKESYRLAIVVLLLDYFKIYRIENENNQYSLHIKEYAVSTTTRRSRRICVPSHFFTIKTKPWP